MCEDQEGRPPGRSAFANACCVFQVFLSMGDDVWEMDNSLMVLFKESAER